MTIYCLNLSVSHHDFMSSSKFHISQFQLISRVSSEPTNQVAEGAHKEGVLSVKCEGNGTSKGCGMLSYYDQPFSASSCAPDHCKVCNNRLLSCGLNAAGHRLYLGQTIFFIRYVYFPSYLSSF